MSNWHPNFVILTCQMWLQVMEHPLILLHFLDFSYIFHGHSCLRCCIFTKISQIMCLVNTHIFIYHYTRYMVASFDFVAFIGNFHTQLFLTALILQALLFLFCFFVAKQHIFIFWQPIFCIPFSFKYFNMPKCVSL